jgi:hypothetical protein
VQEENTHSANPPIARQSETQTSSEAVTVHSGDSVEREGHQAGEELVVVVLQGWRKGKRKGEKGKLRRKDQYNSFIPLRQASSGVKGTANAP